MEWVGGQVEEHALAPLATLEVGSLDVNGSVRGLFTGAYVGVDMRDGPSVDVVALGSALPFPDASFDVVVSTELLEHDAAWWVSIAEMRRVLRPGGHLLITTRGNGFGEHGYPYDYWRFMPQSIGIILELADCDPVATSEDPQVPGIFLHGRRR